MYVLLATVVLQDLNGQESTDYLMPQISPLLEFQQLAHENETDLRVFVDFSDLLYYTYDDVVFTIVLEHSDQDAFETVFEDILRFLGCLVLPFDNFIPNGPTKLDYLDDEVQNVFSLVSHDQLHSHKFVFCFGLSQLKN